MGHPILKICFCLHLLLFPTLVWGLDIPPLPTNYVNDYAKALSTTEQTQLNQFLATYEQKTNQQIFIALFASLENESLEDFSIRLAEAWKPGQKDQDNGVLITLFMQERLIRIEVGYGLEGALPDAQAGLIIQNDIIPFFKQGQIAQGLQSGIIAIIKSISPEAAENLPNRSSTNQNQKELQLKQLQNLFRFILVLFGLLFLIDLIRYKKFKKGHEYNNRRYTFWEWWFRFAITLFIIQLVARIAFYAAIAGGRGGSSSRGGFGGGGGGGFGGGGASGRW